MEYSYRPSGVCSKRIDFELENNKIVKVHFIGGCPGNLTAIAALVEGMDIKQVKEKFRGIHCGIKQTSCADQFVKALEAAEAEGNKLK